MGEVMLQLGFLQFGIDTAAYQTLTRTHEYRWARHTRIGADDALQFTGSAAPTIELEGVIYPDYRAGPNQIDRMVLIAGLGTPQFLVSGQGQYLGRWVVEGITEAQAVFAKRGQPRKQSFTIKLARYDDGIFSLLRL